MLKTNKFTLTFALALVALITSCSTEDPGPIQELEKQFSFFDFDRLEMGSGFNVKVSQGNNYSVTIRGDRRNINDLDVHKAGSTLIIEYDDHGNRSHETYVTITMPDLRAVNFSGGSFSEISGFENDHLDLILSGGSVSQLDAGYRQAKIILTGGSRLRMYGLGDEMDVAISGASELTAFDYPVRIAEVNVSGSSKAKVTVTDELKANAAGASSLLYRGNPSVSSDVSGGSAVRKD
jgi:hypothetical protein